MNFVLLEKRSTKFSVKSQIINILNLPTKWQLLTSAPIVRENIHRPYVNSECGCAPIGSGQICIGVTALESHINFD